MQTASPLRTPNALVLVALLGGLGSNPARAASLTVPLDVSVGPAVFLFTGPLQDEQTLHFGLKLKLAFVVNRAVLDANPNLVSKHARDALDTIGERRVQPTVFLPDTLWISPRINSTQLFGASWELFRADWVVAAEPLRFTFGGAARLTYLYVDSKVHGTTHMVRPGATLDTALEFPVSSAWAVSLGWGSTFYVPQRLGGDFFASSPLDQSIWHVGEAVVKLHYRFPHTLEISED